MILLNQLPGLKVYLLIHLLLFGITLLAQPANDRCSSPTLLDIGLNAETCIPIRGDTRGTEDATTVENAPEVCSGSWFTDDVWYSFTTGDITPPFGVTVEVRLDSTVDTELIEHGMAIYADCDENTDPIDCFSDVPGRRTIQYPPTCLEPNTTYFIRIWSAPEPRTNEGTFSICAYEAPEEITNPNDPKPRIIYEETFDEGFNGWESVSQSQSLNQNLDPPALADNHWIWTNTGCIESAFGTQNCLRSSESTCQEEGVIGIPAGFYQTGWGNPNPFSGPPPYPNVNTYVISPSIDLSNESCVNLTWEESARFLNGGTLSPLGSYVQYSIDGGETWNNPSNAIGSADVSVNYGGEYIVNDPPTNGLQRSIPLIGAEGNTDVRIRFGFDGDFYFWIIDNVRLIEGTAADGVAQSNFFARSHINPMSIHQVDSYDFLIDIANLACEDLTNANVNVTITNSAGAEVHNVDLAFGTIQADSLAENQSFNQPFTPTAVVDEYTNTYTLTSDRDDDLSNNVRTFQTSVVDETVFRKEDGVANGALTPNPTDDVFWTEGEAFTWEMGNIFYATSGTAVTGEELVFNEISFQIANPTDIIGDLLRIWLYEIRDNDFDNIISKDDTSELTRLGISEYIVTGTENGMITVQLESFTGDELTVQPNTHYMATVETTTEIVRDNGMAIADTDVYDYSAAIFAAQQTGFASGNLEDMRYAHSFAISKENVFRIGPGFSGDLTTGNFGQASTPLIRLGYEVVSGTGGGDTTGVATVEINTDIEIGISPNPASTDLVLDLSIEKATDMEVSIVDLAGRVITTRSLISVTEARELFNVNNFANGVYMIHINTKDGVRTEKFVVSK